MQVVRLKFVKKFIKLIQITNCLCVAVYVMLLWCARLFVISAITVRDIYVHSLVELKIILKKYTVPLLKLICTEFKKKCGNVPPRHSACSSRDVYLSRGKTWP